ncbi:hypothetical protein [Haloferax sp. DFSO52]|uniref:hypothetical protein n=1 Tax=Haloferax sp. DFSO52 TaxID=3388505 RepID=UPI003A89CE2F
MSLRPVAGSSRATSEILGLVFAFALVVSVIATAQLAMTPALTAGDEADHQHRVTADLAELDSAVFAAAGTGDAGRVAVDTDVSYPERYLLVSPPHATGTFATDSVGSVTLSNATAVGAASVYWDGTDRVFQTESLVYYPNYAERTTETLHVESGVAYLSAGDGTEVVHRQSLVRGTDITLVLLEDELDGQTVAGQTVRFAAVTSSDRTLTVRSGSDPLTITVPTTLSEETWQDLLADEPYVTDVTYAPAGPGTDHAELTVKLAPGLYDLHLARVSVGSSETGGYGIAEGADDDATDSVAYLVLESPNGTWVPNGGRETVVVRAFDRSGAPVAGAELTWTDGTYGTVSAPDGVITDEDGRVELRYQATDTVTDAISDDSMTVSLAGDPTKSVTVVFEIRRFDEEVDLYED